MKKKKRLGDILIIVLILVGVLILTYPTISNQLNTYKQSKQIMYHEEIVWELTEEEFAKEWELARAFNAKMEGNDVYADVFGSEDQGLEKTEYWTILNPSKDGVMGYISIPKINEKIAIYHGTGDEVLQTGVGHINGSKLPIGGESNHSVLAGHRGLPTAKIFTDLDQIVEGDKFYIHVLDEVLAYEVDQILDMVDRKDIKTLTKALAVEDGEDYVTLFTCTPYGINSHRLLVRGTRVPYNGEDEAGSGTENMLQSVQNYYMLYLILALALIALGTLIMKVVSDRKIKGSNSENRGGDENVE